MKEAMLEAAVIVGILTLMIVGEYYIQTVQRESLTHISEVAT